LSVQDYHWPQNRHRKSTLAILLLRRTEPITCCPHLWWLALWYYMHSCG